MPRNYNNGQYRSCTIKGWAALNYGFLSRIDSQYYDDLGQTVINDTTANLVIGCNSPKPGRAKLQRIGVLGSISSFYSSGSNDKTATLKAADWQLVTPKTPRSPSESSVSKSYYVNVNGLKYAFQVTYLPGGTLPTDFVTATGAQELNDNDQAVWGCSFPKPPVAKTRLSEGDFKTFADAAKKGAAAPEGWRIKGGRYSDLAKAKFYS